MNSTNANLASWTQLGPAAAVLCWMTLKHQFGDAEMRLLECMSITWMHNKQFSEAQLSLKKEHWWGGATQFCTKTMFFTLGFLGAHAPKLLVQQLVRRTAGLCSGRSVQCKICSARKSTILVKVVHRYRVAFSVPLWREQVWKHMQSIRKKKENRKSNELQQRMMKVWQQLLVSSLPSIFSTLYLDSSDITILLVVLLLSCFCTF